METIKIGNLEMKKYAAKKPVAVTPAGEFVTPSELVEKPSLAIGSLLALSEDFQVKLTIERNKLEPDFKLGIIGVGIVTKDELIEHVEARTELGQEIVRAEMNYCNDLTATLAGGAPSKWPVVPTPKPEPIPTDWKWIPKPWWIFFRTCALFCENTTDPVTKYAADYRIKNVHPVFKKRGFCVIVLQGADDVRANFAPKAKSKRVVYIAGIGHGSPTTYTGHLGDPILKVCSYDPSEVQKKVIHLLSCQTAKQLGPDIIKKGGKAYAGYFENFTFVYDQPGTPINEMELFWKCDSTFDIMMANFATAKAAHNVTISAYNAAITSVPGTAAATWLTHNRNYFRTPVINVIYGDKAAKIFPFIMAPLTPFMEAEDAVPELTAV
ncbi:hypothetical protein ES705_36644 [subsurface metagenome]